MPQTDALRGAYCPLIVPFRDGKIDYDTYGELIERQIAEGTHGLLVNATSGEPTMLTLEERAQLVEFVIKTSAGRRPVCAGTASESFDENASLRGVALESSPIPVKYMLKRLGVLKTNEHRSPMVPASPEIEKQLDDRYWPKSA